jgi:hypothetical protein
MPKKTEMIGMSASIPSSRPTRILGPETCSSVQRYNVLRFSRGGLIIARPPPAANAC